MFDFFKNKKLKSFKKTALSKGTVDKVNKLFSKDEFLFVENLLITKCGNNLYGYEDYDEKELERIRFAVLKISDGDINKLVDAVELANLDDRDVLLHSGMHEVNDHLKWNP